MKILTIDIGTGTQDIFLYDSRLNLENGFKLVLPSPTMIVHRRIQAATRARKPILLTGHQMGGGPSAWAAEAHASAGLPVYATPEAATTLNDELDKVEAAGIKVIAADEVAALPDSVERIELRDLDLPALRAAFSHFGVTLDDLAAIAVAVFDHGSAPAGVSDRQFRFDYLDGRIKGAKSLASFAYVSHDIPAIMTRLRAVADSAGELDCPLVVMDTAPAAILGAGFDPAVARRARKIIVNVGNFHTLAFRLGPTGVEGVFEHHTGEIDLPKLESLLYALADGSLRHEDVFNSMGHGALIYDHTPFEFGREEFDIVVTGPRRSMFRTMDDRPQSTPNPKSKIVNRKFLRPYYAVPFGDMMLAGCFGLLAATAEVLPDLAELIRGSLRGDGGRGIAPWDIE
ncbi:MAG TPA: DUF1786 domain-containing protein [Anaerolineales bacterium]|jgi:uncharacterized protein (DUF1786 family)